MTDKYKAPCVGARLPNVEIIKVIQHVVTSHMDHDTRQKKMAECGLSEDERVTITNMICSGDQFAVKGAVSNLHFRVKDEKQHDELNQIPSIVQKLKEEVKNRTPLDSYARDMNIVEMRSNTPIWY